MPSRIEVKGYKSIREMTLDLAPLNVLIGANGAGKSNLVQVFRLLRVIVEENLQVTVRQAGGASRLLYRGPKVTQQIGLKVREGDDSYEALLTFATDDTLFFEAELFAFLFPGSERPTDVFLGQPRFWSESCPGRSITSTTPARRRR